MATANRNKAKQDVM